MKEIKAIIRAYDALDFSQHRAALATVVRVEGSSYRRIGARMLVVDNGVWVGGISGGCLEGDALKRARLAIHNNRPSSVIYDTTEDDAHQIGVNLGCNGVIEVLFTPLNGHDLSNAVEQLRAYTTERTPRVLLTVMGAAEGSPLSIGQVFGEKAFLEAHSGSPDICAYIETALAEVLTLKKTQIHDIEGARVLFEFLPPAIHLVAFGGNYDVFPLLNLGRLLGWQVSLVTNINKVSKALFEAADQVFDKTVPIPTDAYTAFVLMTHDLEADIRHLERVLPSQVPYIGLLGPRKRAQKIYDRLTESGLTFEKNRIFAPVGLDIGALSPEEIALSIAAEIQAFFAEKTATFLRDKSGPIHDRMS